MQEPSVDNALEIQHTRNLSPDLVTSEVRALLQRVRASIDMVETAMKMDDERVDSDDFFILDDITPRYLKLSRLLDFIEASLRAALHDS
jgi:hypothetical protein